MNMLRLYPKPGFTREIEKLLSPYIDTELEGFNDIAWFKEVPKEVLLRAAEFLPPEQMLDRHNLAPTLGELLADSLAIAYCGYIVRASREDERLTLNGVYYPATVDGRRRAAEVAESNPPESIEDVMLQDGRHAILVWWD